MKWARSLSARQRWHQSTKCQVTQMLPQCSATFLFLFLKMQKLWKLKPVCPSVVQHLEGPKKKVESFLHQSTDPNCSLIKVSQIIHLPRLFKDKTAACHDIMQIKAHLMQISLWFWFENRNTAETKVPVKVSSSPLNYFALSYSHWFSVSRLSHW